MCAQEEIESLGKKKNLLKEQLKEIKGSPEGVEEDEIMNIRREIEQDRVVEERLTRRIK